MRKIREVLRLSAKGLSQHEIARSCSIVQSTVHKYLKLAETAGLHWPVPEDWGEDEIRQALLGPTPVKQPKQLRPAPDFAALERELEAHKSVTLQLLWEEYRQQHPDGYRYSRFCELFSAWAKARRVTMRFSHRPGEKMFVDYAGDTVPIHSPAGGDPQPASIFVAVLGFSCYTFACATATQGLPCWIDAHIRALEAFGGVSELVIPDNAKTAVARPCRYEPDLNPTYQDWAVHYDTAVMPARVRKPRDKAKAENGVLLVQRWILAALRKRKFFSLDEVNRAIGELLVRLNSKPFRKRAGTRLSLFVEQEKPALKPLPAERFQLGQWSRHKVGLDYHVPADGHFYSVPYQLAGKQVEVRLSGSAVEIFYRGMRVASHCRSWAAGENTTVAAHRPHSHQQYLEWTPAKRLSWSESVGEATARLMAQILNEKPHPEIGFRSCVGITRLAGEYGLERLESACSRALHFGLCSYRSVASILQHHLDQQSLAEQEPAPVPVLHDNIRGAAYYGEPLQ